MSRRKTRGQGQPWRCRGGHVLGLVVRRGDGPRLLLFREAVRDASDGVVLAEVRGDARGVVCSLCGRRRDWVGRGGQVVKIIDKRAVFG